MYTGTLCRVSSKQTKKNFDPNRSKLKSNRFASVFRFRFEKNETNKSVSKQTKK
jgi:hypothetical protein